MSNANSSEDKDEYLTNSTNDRLDLSDDGSYDDLSEEYDSDSSEGERDDEGEAAGEEGGEEDGEGMGLEEQLKMEHENLIVAKTRIANLIRQITDYQQLMDQERMVLEKKIKIIHAKHQEEIDSLHDQILEARDEATAAKDANNELRKQTVNNLQTLLDEMHNLEEKNELLEQQLRGMQEEKRTSRASAGLMKPLNTHMSEMFSDQRMSHFMEMLHSVQQLCTAEGSSVPPIITPREIMEQERKKYLAEKKKLENILHKEKQARTASLTAGIRKGNVQILSKIEEQKDKLEQEKRNVESHKETIDNLNKKLKELVMKQSDTLRQLEEERQKLSKIEDTIKNMRQQLLPLHITAKALQIRTSSFPSLAPLVSPSAKEFSSVRTDSVPSGLKDRRSHHSRSVTEAFLNKIVLPQSQSPAEVTVGLPQVFSSTNGMGSNTRHAEIYLSLADFPLTGSANCMLVVGKSVWIGCADGIIRIFDKETARVTTDLKVEPLTGIFSMKAVGSREVWTGHRDGRIRIWSVQNFDLRKDIAAHISTVTGLAYDSTRNHVWSVGADMSIRVWDSKVKKCIKKRNTDTYMLCILHHEGVMWIGTESEIVRWDAETIKKIDNLTQHTKLVHHLAVVQSTPSAKQVWSCSSDNSVCVWDAHSGAFVTQIFTDHRVINMVELGDDVWCSTWGKSILRINKKSYTITHTYSNAHNDAVSSLVVVNDDEGGARVWSSSWDKTVCIWKNGPNQHMHLLHKQRSTLTMNWRQFFEGISSASALSMGINTEDMATALATVGKLILALEKDQKGNKKLHRVSPSYKLSV